MRSLVCPGPGPAHRSQNGSFGFQSAAAGSVRLGGVTTTRGSAGASETLKVLSSTGPPQGLPMARRPQRPSDARGRPQAGPSPDGRKMAQGAKGGLDLSGRETSPCPHPAPQSLTWFTSGEAASPHPRSNGVGLVPRAAAPSSRRQQRPSLASPRGREPALRAQALGSHGCVSRGGAEDGMDAWPLQNNQSSDRGHQSCP